MPPLVDDALDWRDRAEQAREVAGQLTDPGAEQAVLQLAESFGSVAVVKSRPNCACWRGSAAISSRIVLSRL